ncbi:ATP-binding protein [Natrinema sp. 1APR25-10V2]|uniref:sensor histidine kinase n=1 Tax=Natrinema sp. 1APR25-10V2 TaxID=2951081 RepID=UPI00287B8A67|nr:ATP-binding protein [Natrinema sp. 1APR25-10V2]
MKYELERQQREEDLRERTEHLSTLIETTPECIKTVAPDGTLLQMNPAGLDMVEAGSASDVIDENVYDLIAPDHRDRFREFNERICQDEERTLEFDIIGLEGTRRHMETHAAPLHKSDGTTVHVALTRDITEQVEREEQLEETVTQLQQSNDRLKQFAYAASHDLQEPLRMVSSYLQLLENQYKDDLDEDAQEYIDFAVNGADRMRAMVDDLLAFSRVEQADGEFESVECDALLERVMNDIQVQIEEANAEITVQSLPTVVSDRSQLEQLFSNLVSNAIKYRGDDPPEIDIRVEERANYWEFSVVDNGIGIDPDKTDRIFEVFKRLHHEDEYPGTGIGLSLCQKIVENHGGEIWVDSEPGEGSTFFVTLPKRTAES